MRDFHWLGNSSIWLNLDLDMKNKAAQKRILKLVKLQNLVMKFCAEMQKMPCEIFKLYLLYYTGKLHHFRIKSGSANFVFHFSQFTNYFATKSCNFTICLMQVLAVSDEFFLAKIRNQAKHWMITETT